MSAWTQLHPRARSATVWLVAVAGTALCTQVLLPRTTPPGVLMLGALQGASVALLAVGIVLLYRSVRVLNLAQAALGVGAAYLTFVLLTLFEWPFVVVVPLGLVAGAATGAAVDLAVMQRFFRAPRLVTTVATIVLVSLLNKVPDYLQAIDVVGGAVGAVENQEVVGRAIAPMPGAGLRLSLEPFEFGTSAIFTVAMTLVALTAVAVFLRRSRVGAAVRSIAENSERALLLGINVRLLSTLVWAIAGALSALAAIQTGLTESFTFVVNTETTVATLQPLVPALAAAILARMQRLPAAAGAAVLLVVLRAAVAWSWPRSAVVDLALLGVIAIGLLMQRRRILRSEASDATGWEAVEELRPVPAQLRHLPVIRTARWAIAGAVGAGVLVLPWALPASQTNLAGLIAIQAIVALSLVVLTGWAGQLSMGQFAFVAVAAIVSGKLTADLGWPFWLALPVVVALVAGFAALVGLPALRIRGSFLAVTTLAFAFAVHSALFATDAFDWLLPATVERPRLFFVSFAGERAYYYLVVAALVLCALAVRRLRGSRPGRVLIGLRDNEAGVQSIGVDAVRTRLSAFALSGALAGVAGVLFAHHQRAIDPSSYAPEVSIAMFVMAMIGGVTSVLGAVLGATYLGIVTFLIRDTGVQTLASSGGLLLLLLLEPGGLAALVVRARDAVLRVVALRQRIVVPALFRDVDAAAVASRRIPLADPIDGQGLAALDGRRYDLPSQLHVQPLQGGGS